MICLIGARTDSTFEHLCGGINDNSNPEVSILDLATLESCNSLSIKEEPGALVISIDEMEFNFSQYRAFFNRCWTRELKDASRMSAYKKATDAILAFLEGTNSLVINKPSAGMSNTNKLLHVVELKNHGFTVPFSFLTNSPNKAAEVLSSQETWVSKSCSGIRTIVEPVDSNLTKSLPKLKICPSQFQTMVEGTNVRVHLIGERVVGVKIDSPVLDYRYAYKKGHKVLFELTEVPQRVEKLCQEYCRAQRLILAGFDFIVKDNNWTVLECNPMPGYDYYDKEIGDVINREIFSTLTSCKEKKLLETMETFDLFVSSERRPRIYS